MLSMTVARDNACKTWFLAQVIRYQCLTRFTVSIECRDLSQEYDSLRYSHGVSVIDKSSHKLALMFIVWCLKCIKCMMVSWWSWQISSNSET